MRTLPRDRAPAIVVGVLGVVTLYGADGAPVPLTDAERRLLAVLTAVDDDGATATQLEEAVWEGSPPRTARQSLHNHLHRLRAKLEGSSSLVRRGERYLLEPRPDTDTAAFASLFTSAGWALTEGDAPTALAVLGDALALWRGDPYAGLVVGAGIAEAQSRLRRLRGAAEDLHARALLADGQTDVAIAELERLITADPDGEARHEMLVEALHRTGRRAEGLAAFRRARKAVLDAQGVEPGERLQSLHSLLVHGVPPGLPSPLGLRPVGRDDVLASLTARLETGEQVELRGEGGIGKSAVLRALARRWGSGALVIDCGGNPFAALGPVATLLDRLAPRLGELGLPTSLDQIAARLPTSGAGVQGSPGTLGRRAGEVIAAGLAAVPKALLLLDDVDRAGPTTRAILAQAVAATTVPVLATAREIGPPLAGWRGGEVVDLDGLDLEGVVCLAEQVLRVTVSEDFGRWLHGSTRGHPLFVIAMLSDLVGRGVLTVGQADPRPPLSAPVPAHVREALQQRIAALGARARRAVDVVAVVGEPMAASVLARLVDLDELRPAIADGLLVQGDDGTLSFAHDLLRRVSYDYVPPGRRAELHHAVAGLELSSAHRAQHLLSALELDPLAAIEAAALAGADAVAAQAYAEGAQWYAAAVAASEHHLGPLERLRLEIEAADASRLGGVDGHAELLLDVAERALQTGDDDLRRRAVLATTQLGGAVEAGPTQQRAAVLAERALAQERDPAWWARLAAPASLVHSIAGTSDLCRQLFVEAWSTAPDDDDVLTGVLPFAYMALGHPDDLEERTRAATRLALAAERTSDPVAAFEAGHLAFSTALQRADGAAARRAHEAMRALTDRVADAGRRWALAYQEAALAALDGRLDEAEALAGVALEIGSAVAPSRAFGAYSGQVYELRRRQGRLDEVADLVLQLVEDQPEIPGWRAAASLALAGADARHAGQLFDSLMDPTAPGQVRELPHDFTWLAGCLCLGRAAVELGDADRASRILPVLEPYAELACWEGTCSWGPVAEAVAALSALTGAVSESTRYAELAKRRWAGLSSAS